MYVQIVTYGLAGISERQYLDVATELTPRFSAMSGLLAKVWLGNSEEGRYGALYLWEDREAMERFFDSDLFEETNPEFSEVVSEDFDVYRNLTAATQPVVELIEARSTPSAKPVTAAPTKKLGRAAKAVPAAKKGKATAKKAKATKSTKVVKAPQKAAGPANKATKRAR